MERYYKVKDLSYPWGFGDSTELLEGGEGADSRTITQQIKSINPDQWTGERRIYSWGGVLLVATDAATHRMIEDLLDDLREKILGASDSAFLARTNRLLDEKTVTFHFKEKTLADAAAYLAKESGLNIVYTAGKARSGESITLDADGIALRDALDRVAEKSGASWGLRDDAVYLTRDSVAKFYQIRDLEMGAYGKQHTPEHLIELIQNIARDSWVDPNSVGYYGGVLQIRTTDRIHGKIEALLEGMRGQTK
ncbi:hypothetical protein ACFL01_03755 [Planctomycetota bacterium]